MQNGIDPLPATSVIGITTPAPMNSPPPAVMRLRQRLKVGDFNDRPDLDRELRELFGKPCAGPHGKARLLELAEAL